MDSQNEIEKYSKMSSQREIFKSLSKKIDRCSRQTIKLTGTIIESIIQKNIENIKKLCLKGFPDDLPMLRAIIWKIYLDYIPIDIETWKDVLPKQRSQYHYLKNIFMKMKKEEYDNKTYTHKDLFCLIAKDVNRTYSQFNFFFQPTSKDINLSNEQLQNIIAERQACSLSTEEEIYKLNAIETHAEVMERILFVFSQMALDLSYQQGMNEILALIYFTFCYDRNFVEETVENVEADSFWAFYNLMKKIKSSFDNSDPFNTFVKGDLLSNALKVVDKEIFDHFESIGLHQSMFCYKWFILLLSQEFPVNEILRLWDIFFMEDNKFFYVFFACLAVIEIKKEKLMSMNDMPLELMEMENFTDIEMGSFIRTMLEIKEKHEDLIRNLIKPYEVGVFNKGKKIQSLNVEKGK